MKINFKHQSVQGCAHLGLRSFQTSHTLVRLLPRGRGPPAPRAPSRGRHGVRAFCLPEYGPGTGRTLSPPEQDTRESQARGRPPGPRLQQARWGGRHLPAWPSSSHPGTWTRTSHSRQSGGLAIWEPCLLTAHERLCLGLGMMAVSGHRVSGLLWPQFCAGNLLP